MALLTIQATGTAEIQARLIALGDDAPNAVARAMERASVGVSTRMSRHVAERTGLTQTRIRKSMRRTKPTRDRHESTIQLYGGRAPLIKYKASFHRGEHLPSGAFKRRMPGTGHLGWFERDLPSLRKSRGRRGTTFNLPIGEVLGPDFTTFVTGGELADLLAYGGERLRAELEHEIAFRELKQSGAA